jgi:hypothetical protein
LKPVVAIPLWLAVPVYVMYAAVWFALAVITMAFAAVIMVGYGAAALIKH